MKDPKLNVRVPPDLDKQFELECVNRGLTKQAATWEALRRWLASESVPKTEQTLTCPRCESTLSVDQSGLTKVMDLGPVPSPETCNVSHKSGVLSEEREWWNLVASAVHVQDPDWRDMLDNIKTQLAQVAAVAQREKDRADGTGVRRGDRGGTAEFDAGRESSVRATKPRREKAG
jgi:hypothetical protein